MTDRGARRLKLVTADELSAMALTIEDVAAMARNTGLQVLTAADIAALALSEQDLASLVEGR